MKAIADHIVIFFIAPHTHNSYKHASPTDSLCEP